MKMASLTIKSAVNYKMNYEADYSQIEFRGQTLPVEQFKRLVSDRKDLATPYRSPPEDKMNMRPPTDDIRVFNKDPLTDETAIEYKDTDELKRNSIVIVKREQLRRPQSYAAERQREPKKILGLEGTYSEESGHLQLVSERSDKIVTESIEGEAHAVATAAGAAQNNGSRPPFSARNPAGSAGRKLMPPPTGYNRGGRGGLRKPPGKIPSGAPALNAASAALPAMKSLDVAQLLAQPLLQSEKDEAREKLLQASKVSAAMAVGNVFAAEPSDDNASVTALPTAVKTDDVGSPAALNAIKAEPTAVASIDLKKNIGNSPVQVKSPKSEADTLHHAESFPHIAGKAGSILSEQQPHQFAVPRTMPNGPMAAKEQGAGVVAAGIDVKPLDVKDAVVENSPKLTEYTDVDLEFPHLSERDKIKLVMSHMKLMYDHLAPLKRGYMQYGKRNYGQSTMRQHHHLQHSNSDMGGAGQYNHNAYGNSTIKMATGIPRQQLQEVPNASYKGAMLLPSGGYAVRIADNEAYKRAVLPSKQHQSDAESSDAAASSSLLPGSAAGGLEAAAPVPTDYTCNECKGIMLGARKQPYKTPCCGKIACHACLVPAGGRDQIIAHDADGEIRPCAVCGEAFQTSQLELQESLKNQIEWWVNHQSKLQQQRSSTSAQNSAANRAKSAAVSQQSSVTSSQQVPSTQVVGPNGSTGGSSADGSSSSSFVAGVNPSLLPASMAAAAAASSGGAQQSSSYTYDYSANGMLGFHNNNTNSMFNGIPQSSSSYGGMSTASQPSNVMYNSYHQPSMNSSVHMSPYGMRNALGGMHTMQQQPQQQQQSGMFQQQQQQMMVSNRMQMGNNVHVNNNAMMRSTSMLTPMIGNNVRQNTLMAQQQQQQQQQQLYNRTNHVGGTLISGQLHTGSLGDLRLSSQSVIHNASFNSGARPGTTLQMVSPQTGHIQQRQNMLGTPQMVSAGVVQPQYMTSVQGRVIGEQQQNTGNVAMHRGMVMQQQQQQPQQVSVMGHQRMQPQSSMPPSSSSSNNNNSIITDDPLALFMSKMNDRDAERFTQRISVHERIGRSGGSNRSSTSDLHRHTGSSTSVTGGNVSASNTTSRRRSRSPLLVASSSSSKQQPQRVTMNAASLAQFDSDSLYDESALEAQQFLAANKAVLEASAAAAESASASTSAITIQARKRVRASFDGTPAASSSVPKPKPPTPPEDTDAENRTDTVKYAASSTLSPDDRSPEQTTGPLTDARSLLDAKRRKRQKVDGVTPTDASAAASFARHKEIRFGDGSSRDMNVTTTPTKPQSVVEDVSPSLASVSRTVLPTSDSSSMRRSNKSSAKLDTADDASSAKHRHAEKSSSKRARDDSSHDDRHRSHRHHRSDAVEAADGVSLDDDGNDMRTSLTSSVASSTTTVTQSKSRSSASTKHRSGSVEKKEHRRHRPTAESETKDNKISKKSRHHREDDSSESSTRRHHRSHRSDRHEKDKKSHRRSRRSERSSRDGETVAAGDSSNGSTTLASASADYAAEHDLTLNTPPSAGDDDSGRHQEVDDDADIVAGGDYVRPASKLHRSSRTTTAASKTHASKLHAATHKHSTPSSDEDDELLNIPAANSSSVRTPVSLDKRFSSSRLLVGALEQIRDQQDNESNRSDSRASNRRTVSRTREHSGRTTSTDAGRGSPVQHHQHLLDEALKSKKSSKGDSSNKPSKTSVGVGTSSDRAANDKRKVAAVPDDSSTSSRHNRRHRDRDQRKQDAEPSSSVSGKIVKKSSSKAVSKSTAALPSESAARSSTLREKPSATSSRKLKVSTDTTKKSVRKPSSSASVAASAALTAAQHDVLDLSSFPPTGNSTSVGDSHYPVFTVNTQRIQSGASFSALPGEGNVLIMASISPTKDTSTSLLSDADRQQHRRGVFERNAEETSDVNDEVVLDVGYDEVAGFLGRSTSSSSNNRVQEDAESNDYVDTDGDVSMDAERRRRNQKLLMARTDSGQSDQSTMTAGDNAPATAVYADDPMFDADEVFDNYDASTDVLDMVDVNSGKSSSQRTQSGGSKASLITSLRQHRRHAKEEKSTAAPAIDSRGRKSKRVHSTADTHSSVSKSTAVETESSKRRHDSRGRTKRTVPSTTASEVVRSSKSGRHNERSSRKERGSTSSVPNKDAGLTTKSRRNAAAVLQTSPPPTATHHRVLSMAALSTANDSKSRTHSPHSAALMAKNPLITIRNRMAIDTPNAPSGRSGVCSSIEMLTSLKHNDNQQLRGVRRNIADRLGDKNRGSGLLTTVSVADMSGLQSSSASSIIGAKSKHFINSYLLPGSGTGSPAVVIAPSGSNMPLNTGPPSTVVGLTTSKNRSQSSSTLTPGNRQQQSAQKQRIPVQQRVTDRIGNSNKSTPAKDYDTLLQQQQQHSVTAGRAGSNSSNATGRDGSVSSRSSPVDVAMMPVGGTDGLSRRAAPHSFESAIMGTHSTEHRREKARAGEDVLRRNLMRAIHDHIKPQHSQQQTSKHVSGDAEML